MAISQNFPNTPPSLLLDFAKSKKLDSRVTFTRSSRGTYVDDNGLIRTAGINEPRFDHNPDTLKSLGLLIEESRTNLVSYSAYNAATWSNIFPANATLTTGIDAPDGSTNAIRLTCSTSGSSLLRVSFPLFTPNGTDSYTTSFYVRLISGNTSSGNILATDLADGSPSGNYLPSLVANKWVRVSFTAIPSASGKNFIDLLSDNTNNYVLDFWGVQIESGRFATSLIPTSGSTVTRSADFASLSGTNFSSWFNASEGTTLISYDKYYQESVLDIPQYPILFEIGGYPSRILYADFGGIYQTFDVYNSTVLQAYFEASTTRPANTTLRFIGAYKANDFAAVGSQKILYTDTSGSIPTGLTVAYIGNDQFFSNTHLNGHISQLIYYPRRLSNTYLQELTK